MFDRVPAPAPDATEANEQPQIRTRNVEASGNKILTQIAASTVSLLVVGVLGFGAYSAITNAQKEAILQQAVQERLAKDGIREMSKTELNEYLPKSLPVLNFDGTLADLRWEGIIRNPRFAPGIYLTKTTVVYKSTMGAKNAGGFGDSGILIGHKFGIISPEDAQSRLQAWKRATDNINTNAQ